MYLYIMCWAAGLFMLMRLTALNNGSTMVKCSKILIASYLTLRPKQTVQTLIRLLLQEQSDQGLYCLPFSANILRYRQYFSPDE